MVVLGVNELLVVRWHDPYQHCRSFRFCLPPINFLMRKITDDDEDIVKVVSRTTKAFRAFGSKVITCTAAN
jgi:hypothetical protein